MHKPEKAKSQTAKNMAEVDQQVKLNEFSNEVFESTVEAAKDLSVIYRKDQDVVKSGSPKKQ
jgi:hypothetical protein